ncbi:protein DGCR6-like [Lineus longissimus]|uniref:protein DGCR6-like n=1 Tax=Lineus longissimus TaxID=88925 RepID=UPI00315C72AD
MAASSDSDEKTRRELIQKRHYFLLHELQNMAKELPGNYQQRLSYDLLSSLASSLLDNTVFEIVTGLREVQEMEERCLFNQRVRSVNEAKAAKQEMKVKHKEKLQTNMSKPHLIASIEIQQQKELEALIKKQEDDLKRKDMKIIMELDQKTMDQQVMLEKAGVLGFFVTNDPKEVRLQMYLLDFITRLSHMDLPS